jgi:tRNA threonylcarbamoyladenosine biosynthesis protein TsaB
VRILALETATQPGSLALLEDDHVLQATWLPRAKRTLQSLYPALQALLDQARWQPRDVQLVAVTQGPGSFTGIRIGVAFAKTWAYAAGCELLGLGTLDVIASQVPVAAPPVKLRAVLDAQRGELFTRRYHCPPPAATWQPDSPVEVVDRAQWMKSLSAPSLLVGEGLRTLTGDWQQQLSESTQIAATELWRPSAEAVGRLAAALHRAGARSDLWELRPYYCRKSAAEEKFEARSGTSASSASED